MRNNLRRLVSLFLILALGLFPVQSGAEAEASDWMTAYDSILAGWKVQTAEAPENTDVSPELSYLIYDIDKDAIPELIVKTGTCEADYHGAIYTFRDGQVFQVGEELSLGHRSFYSNPGDDGIIMMWAQMGYASVVRISLTGGYTEELLYDNAFNLEGYIINQFGRALGNAEEDAFLNGDGQGKPLGIFADKGGGEKSVEVAAGKLTSDDILNLIYSLRRPYRKNASFIMNDQTLAVLRKLKDANQAYIWQPSYQAGEPDRLCGYAIHTSAYCPTLEAGKSAIAFGDYRYYNIGDRGTRSFQELRELFAGNGMVGYVAKERVDGKLVLPEAIKILSVKAAA